MLTKPSNWSDNFDTWLTSVRDGTLVYYDCLDSTIDMLDRTYELDGNFPSEFDELLDINQGRLTASSQNQQVTRRDAITNAVKIRNILETLCDPENMPPDTQCPGKGWIGMSLNCGQGAIVIGTAMNEYVHFTRTGLTEGNGYPDGEFLGWWRY